MAVREQLHVFEEGLLLTSLPHMPVPHPGPGLALQTGTTTKQLNDFPDWINDFCARHDRTDGIP
ncbi:hypothetical protein [Nocardia sp. NPDC047038]|uniref:hypothetical protein n=1 Tax=Nocardia sp. NPDC047038 TaxID=3154338 RepID=UPI0034086E9B